MRIHSIALSVAVFLWAGQAQAGALVLTYEALTGSGSSVDGTPVSSGTPYEIQVLFSDTLISNPAQGVGVYDVSAVTAMIGGVSYIGTTPTDFTLHLVDPTNQEAPGNYVVALDNSGGSAYAPAFTTATPPVVATDVMPTVFSVYNGFFGTVLNLQTAGGVVGLTFDQTVGVAGTSISAAVPEPGSLVLAGIASLAGLGVWACRRRG